MANTIIRLSDVYETRERKEKELAYYREQLEILRQKMFFIQKDIEITTICIQLIEKEQVLDIRKLVEEKRDIE
jgi:prefoldin subunit 5